MDQQAIEKTDTRIEEKNDETKMIASTDQNLEVEMTQTDVDGEEGKDTILQKDATEQNICTLSKENAEEDQNQGTQTMTEKENLNLNTEIKNIDSSLLHAISSFKKTDVGNFLTIHANDTATNAKLNLGIQQSDIKIELECTSSEDINEDITDTSLNSARESITVIRSMIHSSDAMDLDDTMSDTANSSGEGVARISTEQSNLYASNINIIVSPKKGDSCDQEDDDSAFSVGSRVEAKDFEEIWHPARIVEVDSDEMEVLVHYDHSVHRNDEWISVSSPRIRTLSSSGTTDYVTAPLEPFVQLTQLTADPKFSMEYKVGERCYARWNRNRFPATIKTVLEDGKYEIIFDDGIRRICKSHCLYKMKKQDIFGTSLSDNAGTSNNVGSTQLPIPFHRHLFDPELDYLGSKSERREMKKKLDVKTLFNIRTRKEYTPKVTKRKMSMAEEAPPAKKKVKRKKQLPASVPDIEEIKHEVSQETLQKEHKSIESEIKEEQETSATPCAVSIEPLVVSIEPHPSSIEPHPVSIEPHAIVTALVPEVKIEKLESKVIEQYENTDSQQSGSVLMKDSTEETEKLLAEHQINMPVKKEANVIMDGTKRIKDCTKRMKDGTKRIKEGTKRIKDGTKKKKDINKNKDVTLKVGILHKKNKMDTKKPKKEINTDIMKQDLQTSVNNDNPVQKIEQPSSTSDGTLNEIHDAKEMLSCPHITDKEMAEPNYAAHIPEGDEQGGYLNIDEGLKLIAEAVTSFQCEEKTELKPEPVSADEPKMETPIQTETSSFQERYEATLIPGEWCCKWVDGDPQGVVCENEADVPLKGDQPVLPRKSVLVEDKRLPPEWKKLLVRRCYGSSAGKWDVVLIDPNNRRLRDKGEMRNYITLSKDENLKNYDKILMDFSVHRKLARQMGWDTTTLDGAKQSVPIALSPVKMPLHKNKASSTNRNKSADAPTGTDFPKKKKKKRPMPLLPSIVNTVKPVSPVATLPPALNIATPTISAQAAFVQDPLTPMFDGLPLIDGHVYIGSMKVQIIENLFRCPAEGCFKNFRKGNLLRMHIKHYHRELKKFLGATPKVSDLAYARTAIPENTIVPMLKCESDVKITKLKTTPKTPTDKQDKRDLLSAELTVDAVQNTHTTPVKSEVENPSSLLDSPKLRTALENQMPIKRPKVLYPVKKEVKSEHITHTEEIFPIDRQSIPDAIPEEEMSNYVKIQTENELTPKPAMRQPYFENLDFEAAISTHTVTKPTFWKRKTRSPKKPKVDGAEQKREKKKKKKSAPKWTQKEMETWSSDPDTRSGFDTPETHAIEKPVEQECQPVIPQETPVQDDFVISETGERIKIVHMKREEIINCHCGFGEEDGLMIQCDLCLCWQHAICYNYDTNTVPEKYICSICLNPRRGRASRRFLHDQAWLYEGLLPGGAPDDALRRAHELTGNLLVLANLLHTLRVKLHVASKKDHPKLYLWAKDWHAAPADKTTSDKVITEPIHNVDLNEMFREIGKENLPLRDTALDDKSTPTDEMSDNSQRDESHMGSQVLLANLLSSPSGTSLELPISTSELENLAKSVQEAEVMRADGPVPEAAIENSACRKNLLRHIQTLQALVDARLDSIEAQVAELESQDPSLEDDETAEYFPRTKQTVQMLYRDLNALEELAIIT